jgi:dTDP-4-amino-4,6-dideoxygalactose transaminase
MAKLEIFPEEIGLRQQAAERYNALLKGLVETPVVAKDRSSVWAQYSVQSDRRQVLMDALKAAGVPTAIYYPKPLHLQTAFANLRYKAGDFPVSELVSERIFSLPMHPYLAGTDQERIAGIIRGD